MKYEKFKNILNHKIFEESKADLIRKFADYPERYIGLFRPTKPKGKIIQNLTQSQEIKFGDAFEIILEEYFKMMKWDVIREPMKSKYRPTSELLNECRAVGKTLGEKAKQIAQDIAGEKICINP